MTLCLICLDYKYYKQIAPAAGVQEIQFEFNFIKHFYFMFIFAQVNFGLHLCVKGTRKVFIFNIQRES